MAKKPEVEVPGTILTVAQPTAVGTPVSDEVRNAWVSATAEDLGFAKSDVAIPFLRILQSNSPQAVKRNDAYVDGAEPGDFINTATNRIYSGTTGALILPVQFQRSVTEWYPRPEPGQPPANAGKTGFVKDHGMDESLFAKCTKNAKGKDITPTGTELVLAARYYSLVIDEETGGYSIVAFDLTSTQLKKARQWNALITDAMTINPNTGRLERPQPWGYSYRVTTVPEKNNKGEWFGVKIGYHKPTIDLKNGEALYMAGVDLKKLCIQDLVRTVDAEITTDDGGSMNSPETPF